MTNLPDELTDAVAADAPLARSQSWIVVATSEMVQAPWVACAPVP